MRFLIDECLSTELVHITIERGFVESSHIVWRKLQGTKDWNLVGQILDGDWTFVTKNSVDFRGPATKPGSKGHYRAVGLHAGLVCLNGPVGMDLDDQCDLFEAILDDLRSDGDLVNQVIEGFMSHDGQAIEIARYPLPADLFGEG